MRHVIHQPDLKQINFLDDRFYTFNGVEFYPSVTTILDVYPKGFGFNQWLKDVGSSATEIVERAANIGSLVHNVTELLNAGEEITWANEQGIAQYSQHEWELILRFADFWRKCKPELIANEQSFCSKVLGFGGTLDRVVVLNGKRWLIDIKTSNYIHTSHELQIAAYAVLWNEFNPTLPIHETAILWLKSSIRKDGIDPVKDNYQGVSDAGAWQLKKFDRHYLEAFEVFKHTQAIWREENPNFKPKNYQLPDRIKL